jgi:hypothetical protein
MDLYALVLVIATAGHLSLYPPVHLFLSKAQCSEWGEKFSGIANEDKDWLKQHAVDDWAFVCAPVAAHAPEKVEVK